ncbi:iron complex outermembrane receptor protein [Sphingomonas sp. PvP055]|uniref:TonB-dependent receptor domain-containing protein n=1 Tax=Sphingomonas sp. PvP055 TaxID=3156391 RepID=UPI003394E798
MTLHTRARATRVGLAALAAATTSPLLAQTAEPRPQPTQATPDEPDAAGSAAQDIVVTGSRIRGVPAVGSNVIALDQSKIAQEPVTSVSDILRRVPQVVGLGANRNGGSAQNGQANATRGAGINLRGISTNATLLLFNGERFPPQGTQGQFTDPSVLPSIALSRIEIVADGASAIYGSDAITGVVNFILRKDLDGVEVRARSAFTHGGYAEQQVAAIAGTHWNGGSAMLAGEYTSNAALYGSQLPYYQNDNRYRGGRDLRTTNCNPGTITVGGQNFAIPVGGVTPATAGALVAGTSNRCFYNGQDAVIPQQQRVSVVGQVSQDLGPLRLFGDGFYSYRDGIIPGTGDTFTATVRPVNPFFVSPVAGATSVTAPYSLLPELGPDLNPYHATSWSVRGGVEAKLFADFKGTFYYQHGESTDVADRRLGVNTAALNAALADPNPATALNLFGGANNPATLARIRDNYFVIAGATRLDVANVQLDGSLLALPGGNVRIAAGGEYRKEYTFTDLTTGTRAAQIHTAAGGSRDVKAVFGELFVPIFGTGNAIPGFEQLSLSLAGRYEHYSDFGDTTNPKFGITWKPLSALTLRGSYGTSFRAPTFVETSQLAGGAGLYYDTLPGANGNLTGIGLAGGNPNLQPETARTWSGGGEFAPAGILKGLVLNATYFHIDYRNQIQALRGTPGILTNPLYASFVNLSPSAAQVAALVTSGLPINSPINSSAVSFIVDGRRQNLGRSRVAGIDFGANYHWTTGDWRIDGGVQGTYFTQYKFQAVPGAGFSEVINTINFPQKFRLQGDVGVATGKLHARVTVNHLSGYRNTTVTPVQHVAAYDTVDFLIGFDVSKRFTLSFDVRNLLDASPPFVDTTFGYDPQSVNPVPRLLAVTAGVKF